MSSLKYWERRKAQRMFEYMQTAEDTADDIAKLYQAASGYLSHEMDQIFQRYKQKHHLTDAEAYRLLNILRDKTSLDELKQALRGQRGNQSAAEILAELESPAYQARLERLQQLQNQIDLTMQQIYGQEKDRNTSHYVDLANEAYYKSIFDIQQRTRLGFSFAAVDPKVIDQVINSRWSGANYSKRIWGNTQALAQDLKQELLVSLVTGRTDRETADIIANKYAQGASNARRLVRTESCNLANQMEMQSYEECGIETYIFVATLDLRTSTACRELDGKRFPVSGQQAGRNCPPMHPWCRSTTICDISDEELAQMKRRARDPKTGRTITIPANMTYSEWKKVVDEGGDFASWKKPEKPDDSENQKRYAAENPYEAFAEGFLALNKGEKIPENIESVISEALRRSNAKPIANRSDSDIIISGARITNLFSKEAEEFAKMYYKEIRSFSTDASKIAKNLGKNEDDITRIKEYLFEDNSLYDPDFDTWRRFDPDCAIAQSWQRLMIGKDIKPHDRTLIEHELLEMQIKKENPDIDHYKAHEMATQKYDYRKEAAEYYGNLEKNQKDGK